MYCNTYRIICGEKKKSYLKILNDPFTVYSKILEYTGVMAMLKIIIIRFPVR